MFADMIHRICQRDRIAIARAISIVEDERDASNDILSNLFPFTGQAYRIGITGPPGAGKSSITDKLIHMFRDGGKTVAVISVAPSSPFTGGALLGDRIRMVNHHGDAGVFIRSMASRGGQGGLANKTKEVADIFDAAGYDIILFETVGVGQVELDVMEAIDTVLVVLVPESGDDIQMMKAGLMEIAHIFIINKADREGSNKLFVTLNNILHSTPAQAIDWYPEVSKTVATTGEGMQELLKSIDKHRTHIVNTGLWKKNMDSRYNKQVKEAVTRNLETEFWKSNHLILGEEMAKPYEERIPPFKLADKLQEK